MAMTGAVEDMLDGFPVVVVVPVAWGDMDAYQHVNNTVFFRYFESARIACLARIGFATGAGRPEIGPILHSTTARFRRPLVYPDTTWTGARIVEVMDDRFTMEYRVISERSRDVAAEGSAIVVSYDYGRGRKAQLPESVRHAIDRLVE